jgi:hypothetical protein
VKRTQKQNPQDDKKRKQTKALTAEAQSRRETRNNERQNFLDRGNAETRRKQTKVFTAEAQSRRETRNSERQSSQDQGCAGIAENEKKDLAFLNRSPRFRDSAVKWVLPQCFGLGLDVVLDPRRSEELL